MEHQEEDPEEHEKALREELMELYARMPIHEKAKFEKPRIFWIDYEVEMRPIKGSRGIQIREYKFGITCIEDCGPTAIKTLLEKQVARSFPFIQRFSGESEWDKRINCTSMYDIGNNVQGAYYPIDNTQREESDSPFINEGGVEKEMIRGYGFYGYIQGVNSREAATFTRELCTTFNAHLQPEEEEYLRGMKESNIGISAKAYARKIRKSAIMERIIAPTFGERFAIITTRGKYLGRRLSPGEIMYLLEGPREPNKSAIDVD